MTLPSAAEVELADWPALKAYAAGLGLNPKGRSGIVRRRVLDALRAKAGTVEWKAGKAEQAALLTRLGLADAAADLWESTISLDAPAPWVGLGTAYLKAGRPEEALRCFDRAIGMGDPGARLHKAHALMQSGKSDAALAEVGEAINSNAGDVRALARRASLAEAGGRTDEAVASATALSEAGHGRTALARILMRAGRFTEAGRALEAHVAERPADALAWNNLGACRARQGLWEKALEGFRRAAALDARDAGIQNNLAVALAATGKDDEALRRFQAARRIAEDPRVLLNEAALRERMQVPAAAREVYERVLEVAPANPEAMAGRRRVSPRPRARRIQETRPATRVPARGRLPAKKRVRPQGGRKAAPAEPKTIQKAAPAAKVKPRGRGRR
jgi:tetratricopeptide (TPR) repeat protein